MPDVKVYIRQENLDKWNAIASKADWINTLLANSDNTSSYGAARQTPVGPMVTVLTETIKQPVAERLPDIPGLGVASDLAEPECKRHHQPVSMCARLH